MTNYTSKTSSTSIQWTDPATWLGGVVPNAPDADVTVTGPVTLNAGQPYAVRSLAVGAGIFSLNGNLNVSGPATVNGSVSFSGTTADLSTGGLTIAAGGSLNGYGEVDGNITVNGAILTSIYPSSTNSVQRLLLTGTVSGAGQLSISAPPIGSVGSGVNVLELAGADSANVTFRAADAVLQLDSPSTFTGTITPSDALVIGGNATRVPQVAYDQIILAGVSLASVTGLSYSAASAGGTLTIQEGAAQQNLAFAGNYTAANFLLSAGPQGAQPSLDVTVTPTPAYVSVNTPPSFANPGGTNQVITNNSAVRLAGAATAGTTVAVSAGGATSAASTYSSYVPNAYSQNPKLESYSGVSLNLTSSPGLQRVTVTATATNAAGSVATTTPFDVDLLPAPINGVTTTNMSSGAFVAMEQAGFQFDASQLAVGTEAITFLNGTLSVGPDTAQALIERLYVGLLNRYADQGGLNVLSTQIDNGVGPEVVAAELITSPEGVAQGLSTLAPTQYVQNLYTRILGRSPSGPDAAGWVNQLNAGATRGQVAVAIASSAEGKVHVTGGYAFATNIQAAVVTQLFETALGRDPEAAALSGMEQALTAGLTPQALSQIIASSGEFGADHNGQSPEAFVTGLYQAGLGRVPAASEVQGWVAQIQGGAAPAAIVYGIATSAEATMRISPVTL